jgi:hypothetical protein
MHWSSMHWSSMHWSSMLWRVSSRHSRVNQVLKHGLGQGQHQVRLHFASIRHQQASATRGREHGKHRSLARRVLGWRGSYRHVMRGLTQASHALSRRRQAERAQRAFAPWSAFLSQLCTVKDSKKRRWCAAFAVSSCGVRGQVLT